MSPALSGNSRPSKQSKTAGQNYDPVLQDEENLCHLNLQASRVKINSPKEENPSIEAHSLLPSDQQLKLDPFNAQPAIANKMFLNPASKSVSETSKRRILAELNDDADCYSNISATKSGRTGSAGSSFCRKCLNVFLVSMVIYILLLAIVYIAPMEDPQIETKISPERPRPKFVGALGMNERLDEAEILFENQFHAPESFAWRRLNNNQTFYTGVEGGFILEVNPFQRKWHVVAQLNSPDSQVTDEAHKASYRDQTKLITAISDAEQAVNASAEAAQNSVRKVPYCWRDVELYGEAAKTEPGAVILSRCSRPLGIRLSPDESYLYAVDPFSGLYRIQLTPSGAATNISRLIDFSRFDVLFADDLAVKWADNAAAGGGDKIYLSDCSRRVTLRYLIRMMIEYDDTGRILEFDTGSRELRPLSSANPEGNLKPVMLARNKQEEKMSEKNEDEEEEEDWRNLSFPNGVELVANSSALLVSDLNNRRILMHHLEGPLKGKTRHLLWVPGYSDNIKRGVNRAEDGAPTYWLACGCAVSDGRFEIAEFFNQFPVARKLNLKMVHYIGSSLEWLGQNLPQKLTSRQFRTSIENAGLEIKAMWLKKDPYCTHGLVMQFDETGRVLRTLHAPHYSSSLKIVSEAHEVPDTDRPHSHSHLFVGSVYYSYLGHLQLEKL